MEYKVINLKNNNPYFLPIPNQITEGEINWYNKIILELQEKIEELEKVIELVSKELEESLCYKGRSVNEIIVSLRQRIK